MLISHWFPALERARAYGFWMMNIAIVSIITAPLSGGAMGLINALGNLGGFAGPYIGGWLQDASGGSFLSTAVVLAVSLLLGGLIMITLREHADKPTAARPAATARRAPASPVKSSPVKSR